MQKTDIICVGKVKEGYLREAVLEYSKRLSAYCRLSIVEVADEAAPEKLSPALQTQIKDREGERILEKISDKSYVIALEIAGKTLSSEGFAKKLDELANTGRSHIQFVIGGSLGLSEAVLSRADYRLSFSAMTFPHQLMRVILLEQIYRAFRINTRQPYHK